MKKNVVSCYFDLSTLDLSKSRVRCNGVSLDKCSLSSLIHELGFKLHVETTWSDVYWYDAKYSELVEVLKRLLNKL